MTIALIIALVVLHVRWRSTDDVDEAAWQVKDLDTWLEALRKT